MGYFYIVHMDLVMMTKKKLYRKSFLSTQIHRFFFSDGNGHIYIEFIYQKYIYLLLNKRFDFFTKTI